MAEKKRGFLSRAFRFAAKATAVISLGSCGVLATGSTVTHMVDENHSSKPLSTFMAENGLSDEADKYFHTKNIRVYERGDVLGHLHAGGAGVRRLWTADMGPDIPEGSKLETATKIMATPFAYAVGLMASNPLSDALFPVNASTIFYGRGAVADRSCFIRPHEVKDALSMLQDITGHKLKGLEESYDMETMAAVYNYFVMFHEARHCDQSREIGTLTLQGEADSDIYALRAIKAEMGQLPEITLMRDIIQTFRIINGVRGDAGHTTLYSFDENSIASALRTHARITHLSDTISEIERQNKGIFPAGTKRDARNYHMTKAYLKDSSIEKTEDMRKTARDFTSAIEYMNILAKGDILKGTEPVQPVKLSHMTQTYTPVPSLIPGS